MRPVKDLWGGLVEQRLWPLALVLVLALVAVPLVLARSPPPEDPGAAAAEGARPLAAVAAAADLREPGEAVVSVAQELVQTPLRGRAKNPFLQQRVPKADGALGGIVLVPGDGSAGVPLSPEPVLVPDGPGGGGGGEPPVEQPRSYVYASIDVRFGRAGMPLRTIEDVPRLTPLPGDATPIVIFLGMRGDHETALFMLSTDVHAQGDGRCVPSVAVCEAIELREGQIAFLDFRAEDGTVTQYELDLVDVELHETTSRSRASRTIARSADARRLLGRAGGTGLGAPADAGAPLAAAGATRSVSGVEATASAPRLTPLP